MNRDVTYNPDNIDRYPTIDVTAHRYVLVERFDQPFVIVNDDVRWSQGDRREQLERAVLDAAEAWRGHAPFPTYGTTSSAQLGFAVDALPAPPRKTRRWIEDGADGYVTRMAKNTDTQDATEFDAAPATSPAVHIEAKHGQLRYRTTDGTDTGKSLDAFPGQQVWLEATAKGEAEAEVTTTWPGLENGEEVRTITEPGLIYG